MPRHDIDLTKLNAEFEKASPQAILSWAWDEFAPHLAATSSFQTQSLPLLHMIASTIPDLYVYFLDTGFHFPETLAFRDELMAKFGIKVHNLTAEIGHNNFRRRYGELYRTNPDTCCYINKVEPWQRLRAGLDGWISGIRRDQTADRRDTPIVSKTPNGQYKICPLACWQEADIWRYLHHHDLPVHPLFSQGYLSIGCQPCTRPVSADEDARDGRWAGSNKVECGLHKETSAPHLPPQEPTSSQESDLASQLASYHKSADHKSAP